ncbi:MAG: chorismate synthase [Acidobacteriota bacterium]|nr:chorismate synthase [Acidobacteriota bacterium]MDW8257062.1 chorismate synthase [Acidobacteriota bacterium]
MAIRFLTAGESHGRALVAIVEGFPAGLSVDVEFIARELRRRQGGFGRGARQKIERDRAEILSGVRHGRTLGSPIALLIENRDFANWQEVMALEPRAFEDERKARRVVRPRPGHADLAGGLKYNTHDLRDILERASARETAARVAVGALAKLLLREFGLEVSSHVLMVGGVPEQPREDVSWEEIQAIPEDSPLRCADPELEAHMIARIEEAMRAGDTVGGLFEVVAHGVPPGLGTHTQWDLRLDGRLAQAIMSIQGVKAVEIGLGVMAARWPGSRVHDEIFYDATERRFYRKTNRAGGIEGGISNGEEIRVRGYLKPLSTLRRPLNSVNVVTKEPAEATFERSDVTAITAAGVIGEAMVAIVLAQAMREKFGGDSLEEMKQQFLAYQEQLRAY